MNCAGRVTDFNVVTRSARALRPPAPLARVPWSDKITIHHQGTFMRAGLTRHQTLRSALDWSHRLLSGDEQRVFRRLGIFTGDFSLELARAVVADGTVDDWAVVEHLATLIERSLVVADSAATPRYRLLETMPRHIQKTVRKRSSDGKDFGPSRAAKYTRPEST